MIERLYGILGAAQNILYRYRYQYLLAPQAMPFRIKDKLYFVTRYRIDLLHDFVILKLLTAKHRTPVPGRVPTLRKNMKF